MARIVRVARTARPFGEGRAPARPYGINERLARMGSRNLGGNWDGRLARCNRLSSHSTNLSELTHPELLSFPFQTYGTACALKRLPPTNQGQTKE